MNWVRKSLGELIETQKGYTFKSSWYQDTGHPIVKVSDFTDNSVDTSSLVCISDSIAQDHRRCELHEGEVVVQTVGTWRSNPLSAVGKCIRVPREANDALLNQNAVRILPREGLDNDYLYYALRSPQFIGYIIGTARGSASQAAITLEAIRNFRIPMPPLSTQSRIAAILSAYDDLIGNNRRRFQLLEHSVRLLYKEWFVRLRFPGHEHHNITDNVPNGWKRKVIGECFRIILGGTPSRKKPELWGGDVPWINSGEVNKTRILSATEFITEEGLAKSPAKMMPIGTTVIAITGTTLGQVSRLEIACAGNQSVVGIFDTEDIRNEWLYLFFVHEIRKVINHATGGAQQHITKEIVKATEYLEPPKSLLGSFRELVRPSFLQMKNIELQNISLAQARDLLLPRLMSGEVVV